MSKLFDRVKMTISGTPGTGSITLNAAVLGYRSLDDAGVQDGDVVSYVIEDVEGAWEVGHGTYTASGTVLDRTTPLASSIGGASKITVTSSAVVFLSALAADIITPTGGAFTDTFTGTFTDGIVVDYTHPWGRISVGTSDGLIFYTGGVGSTEVMRLTSGGNLGLGNTSPDAKLSASVASFGDGTVTAPSIAHTGDLNTGIYFPTLDSVAVTTAGTERLRIDSSGFVGIKTSGPDAELTVNGVASFSDGSVSAPAIAHKGDLNTGVYFPAADQLAVTTAGAQRLLIDTTVKSPVGIFSTSQTAGIGYTTGAGGAVTQSTNKSTAVTLNTICGQITMNNAALAGTTSVDFTLQNSAIGANDVVIAQHAGPTGTFNKYRVDVNGLSVGGGGAALRLTNLTAGSLSDAVVINFVVLKGVSA